MSIRDLHLIARKPNRELDIQGTLQAFAKELLAWKDEEKKIRSNRRFKTAIKAVFKKGYARVPMQALIALAMQHLNFKPEDYRKLSLELEQHIKFNRGGYLRTVPGKAGGVELTKP